MEKMKMKKVESQTVKDKRLGLILMIPIVLVIFIIMGIPLIRAIYWSFTDKVVGSNPNFIGLKNYIGLFQDKVYWKSLRNTAIYTGGCILAKLLLGLLWAVLLNQDFKGKGLNIDDQIIDTESNLWYIVLQKNLYKIGLPINLFDDFQSDIDALVNRRNSIAHGNFRSGVTAQEFANWEIKVSGILSGVIRLLYDYVNNERYLI